MKMTMEMPPVSGCEVFECAYNRDKACRAHAITIGDGENPRCDTFFPNAMHAKQAQTAGVGACKVCCCSFNDDFECQAQSIQVDSGADPAACMTFQKG